MHAVSPATCTDVEIVTCFRNILQEKVKRYLIANMLQYEIGNDDIEMLIPNQLPVINEYNFLGRV